MNSEMVHYKPDCENASKSDLLAPTGFYDEVNCQECLTEMHRLGFFDPEDYDDGYPDDYDPREDMYWSGTGELMNDDSYINYLNNY